MTISKTDSDLKYFFLIDTDFLIEKIVRDLQDDGNKDILPTIFSTIKTACKMYFNEIFDVTKNFNHAYGTSNREENYALVEQYRDCLYRTLEYHCILHGFLHSIKDSDAESSNTIKISGAHDTQLKHGYFKTGGFIIQQNSLPDGQAPSEKVFQYYNNYKKRFKTSINHYAYSIINSQPGNTDGDFLSVPKYNGNWTCFIYSNPEVASLDNAIFQKTSTIIKHYSKLLEECMKWCSNNNLSPEDLFLFEHAMESIYGFSFFEYISKLLNEIHNTSHDNNNINLKDFEGTVVLDFIQQVAQLPITYNRSFFLEYALFPILKSECLKSQEYRKSAKSLFTHLSFKPAPKSTLVISGLGQITKYLQKLTYIALPLIENLWDVTIDKLNHNNSINLCINTDTYREYIKSNYNKIIKRNSLLFRDDATHSMLYHKFTYETILSSQYERESLNYLLQSYFNVERFNRPHTSLNSAIAPFVYSMEPLTMDHMHNNELNFVNRHIDNILSYAENIYPDK